MKRKECFRDRYMEPQLSLCLLNRGTRNVPLCQWCSAQQAAYEGGKAIPYAQDVHNCWQALLAECLKRIADLKETKILPHPCSPSLGFMYLYVHMWKLYILIGKLWCFRWNCLINSRWKEVRRIQRGESFHSSQVRVTYTYLLHPQWYKYTKKTNNERNLTSFASLTRKKQKLENRNGIKPNLNLMS